MTAEEFRMTAEEFRMTAEEFRMTAEEHATKKLGNTLLHRTLFN
jgi:hypothetical protein